MCVCVCVRVCVCVCVCVCVRCGIFYSGCIVTWLWIHLDYLGVTYFILSHVTTSLD